MKYLLVLLACISSSAFADSVTWDIVDRNSTRHCNFMRTATIDVAYELRSKGTSQIIVMTTETGNRWESVKRKSITRGRDNVSITFDAGPCTRDIKVIFQ